MSAWEEFFRGVKKPENYENDMKSVNDFVEKHLKEKRNIAFVTVCCFSEMTTGICHENDWLKFI